jgi:formylglycine-generating enzyme required for sulfatase activity
MTNHEPASKANILKRSADFFKRSAREASWVVANTALGFLAAGALFPFLVEQPEKALAGLLGGASVEILSSWLMRAAGKREIDTRELIAAVNEELAASEGFRRAVEELVAKIGAGELAAQATSVLSAEDKQRFLDTLGIEVMRYGFRNIEISGDGNVVGHGNFVIVQEGNHYHYHYYGPVDAQELEPRYLRHIISQYEYWRDHYTALAAIAEEKLKMPGDLAVPSRFVPPGFAALERRGFGPQMEIRRVPLDSLQEAAERYDKVVLLGEPGCGKTTSLWRLAWEWAERALEQEEDEVLLPLLLSLGEYSGDEEVLEFVADRFGILQERTERYLQDGRLLLLFDALNEMPRRDYKDRVERLRRFVEKYCDNRYIFTCRALDYDETLGLQRVEIERLDEERIKGFLVNYLREEGERLYRILEEEQRELLEMGHNPYMLRMILQVYAAGQGALPTNRAELFTAFAEALLEREKKRSPDRWIEEKAQMSALSRLAFAIQEEWGRGTVVETGWAERKLQAISPQHPPEALLHLAAGASIVELADHETVRFYHHLLQEYFAAIEMGRRFEEGGDLTSYWRIPWLKKEMPPFERTEENRWEPLPPPPPTGWEETTILLAGMEEDASRLVAELMQTNPVLAGRCAVEGQAATNEAVRATLADTLLAAMEDQEVALRARIAAGEVLGHLGDPRFGGPYLEPGLVEVPAGEFWLGSSEAQLESMKKFIQEAAQRGFFDYLSDGLESIGWTLERYVSSLPQWIEDELPAHRVPMDDFYIAKYPVTNAQYTKFVEAGGYDEERYWTKAGWDWRRGPLTEWDERRDRQTHDRPAYWDDPRWNKPNYPVVGVTWYEAVAYCSWLSEVTGKNYRLPTEAQWEKAARGSMDQRQWPWGEDFDPEKANTYEGEEPVRSTTPVGIYPQGASLCGALDMIGNVWEWTSSLYKPYPYNADDGREEVEAEGTRVLRGGSFYYNRRAARVACRGDGAPDGFSGDRGLRVVLLPPGSP